MKLFRRFAIAVSLSLMVVAGSGVGAHAATSQSTDPKDVITIRKVDTTQFPTVELTVLRPQSATSNEAIRISENGKAVTNADVSSVVEANVPVGVVLAIDTSEAMTEGDSLTKAKAAAVAMVNAKSPNEQFAIVAFNGSPRRIINFTSDAGLLKDAIDKLSASNDSAMWGGLSTAAAMFSEESAANLQANVVVISDSTDTVSASGTYTKARAALRSENAAVFSVIVKQRSAVAEANLKQLSTDTGGHYVVAEDADSLTPILAGIGKEIASQSVITYQSLGGTSLNIEVSIGNSVASAHAAPGTLAEGAEVAPVVIEASKLPAFMTGSTGLAIVAALSLCGVGLLLYGIIEIAGNERNQLSRALRPYSDEPEEERDFSKIADSEIIKKAVASTAKIASDRGILQQVQSRLEQADLPLRPAEALFFTGVAALVAMVIGAVTFGILGLAFAGLIFAYLPVVTTSFLAKRRRKKFTSQLPDTLQLLSGSLRAGYSLVQGLDAVAKQCEAPMGTELQRAMSEARLGRPVEEALQEVSDRMGSEDFEWAVMAVKIQREVGGNLAELLVTVSETMIARERLRREVKALTAEGRISAIVLAGLPFAIGGVVSVLNPRYMEPLFSTFIGQAALVGAVLMIIVGYFVMTKLMEVEA